VTNISQSFYLQDGGKNQLAPIWNKITSLAPYVKNVCLHYPVATSQLLSTRISILRRIVSYIVAGRSSARRVTAVIVLTVENVPAASAGF